MSADPWRAVPTADGSTTLEHTLLGQACHSSAGAWSEARERYAAPTRLAQRARAGELPRGARVLDVGTGLGLNLAAALEALDGTDVPLEAVSLEIDRRVIEHTLALPCVGLLAPWWAPVRAALALALEAPGTAVPLDGDRGHVMLLLGDGRATLPAHLDRGTSPATFDAVFLDPFSPGVDPPLWSADFLECVATCMAPGGWLSTYSASTRVRAHLAAAGLEVGRGPRVGAKAQGTLASPDAGPEPLPEREGRKVVRRAARLRADSPGSLGSPGSPRGAP